MIGRRNLSVTHRFLVKTKHWIKDTGRECFSYISEKIVINHINCIYALNSAVFAELLKNS